ncbi:hypothetical protein AKJ08_2222 [Vulgatibacter incomptus]|uniref:Uncharacterized protein n=1 Tax=Vulgatibacter incomptus TaxID=1391653 RepID=A0A0K1PE90_9BACT|nr:hypothetical protein AKJ08_2222 [Vulgatibacter incomptus]
MARGPAERGPLYHKRPARGGSPFQGEASRPGARDQGGGCRAPGPRGSRSPSAWLRPP